MKTQTPHRAKPGAKSAEQIAKTRYESFEQKKKEKLIGERQKRIN